MAYQMPQKVLFKHCDPAGIVFFPRYFEMMNDCVEAFFDDVLHHPFEMIHRSGAVPTAKIDTRFSAPSRHGDHLILRLQITGVGRTSAKYEMTAHAKTELRFQTQAVLVNVDAQGKPTPWAPGLARKLKEQMEPEDAA